MNFENRSTFVEKNGASKFTVFIGPPCTCKPVYKQVSAARMAPAVSMSDIGLTRPAALRPLTVASTIALLGHTV